MVVASAMVMVSGETGLLQLLRGRHLPAIGRILELGCQVFQLRGLAGVAAARSRLCGLCEVAGDGGHQLVELSRTLDLKLLQLTQKAGGG
jgi:hypothetical protein